MVPLRHAGGVTREDSERRAALASVWAYFAERECGTYSPLYAGICRGVSEEPELLDLVLAAPQPAHQPNVLLGAVHYLILGGLDHPLAAVYSGQGAPGADAASLFRDLCLSNREALLAVMETRRTQTNECGRSAVLALGLAVAAKELGPTMSLLDAGASAGLNLLVDEYRINYGSVGSLGPSDAAVQIDCRLDPAFAPVPERLPHITHRLGLDRSPVDLNDPDGARWLLACVWPDTGRLERTSAAIAVARHREVTVVQGDMVEDLPEVLKRLPGPLAVVTSWVCAYLSSDQRSQFGERLAEESRSRPVAWLSAEGPGVVQLIEPPDPGGERDTTPSVLGLAVYRDGEVQARPLALMHPHGTWIDWRDQAYPP